MDIDDGGKKLEKLNLRVSESERDLFERARIKSGLVSVSAWARQMLIAAADSALKVEDKPKRDIAVYLASERIYFGTDNLKDEPFDIRILKDTIVEGHVVDVAACKAALCEGFRQLRSRFDLSNANALVTSRLLPSNMRFLKDMLGEVSGIKNIFLIEFSMANAIGINVDVHSVDSQPIVSVERDWLEVAEVCGAGLRRQRSMAWNSEGEATDGSPDGLIEKIQAWMSSCDAKGRKGMRIAINVGDSSWRDALASSIGATASQSKSPAIIGTRRALPTVRQLFPDAV